jgi:hypothetical protein
MPILEWNAGRFSNLIADKVERGMTKAVIYVEGVAKQMVSRGNVHGDNPSLPGEPWKTVTGFHRANITHLVVRNADSISGFIGERDNVEGARRLELGFVGIDSLGRNIDQAPRPVFRPALLRSRDKIVELIAKG